MRAGVRVRAEGSASGKELSYVTQQQHIRVQIEGPETLTLLALLHDMLCHEVSLWLLFLSITLARTLVAPWGRNGIRGIAV